MEDKAEPSIPSIFQSMQAQYLVIESISVSECWKILMFKNAMYRTVHLRNYV